MQRHARLIGTSAQLADGNQVNKRYGLVTEKFIALIATAILALSQDTFDAFLLGGRSLKAEERTRHARNCAGYGARRGGDSTFASAARARVKQFLAEHLKLQQ